MMRWLLDRFVDVMFRIHCFTHPDQVAWWDLCAQLGLDPINPFPDMETHND